MNPLKTFAFSLVVASVAVSASNRPVGASTERVDVTRETRVDRGTWDAREARVSGVGRVAREARVAFEVREVQARNARVV